MPCSVTTWSTVFFTVVTTEPTVSRSTMRERPDEVVDRNTMNARPFSANIAPRAMHELCVAAIAGDAKTAMAIQKRLLPVHKHLFCEANPIPLKWAMARMGLCGETMRLPLTPMSRQYVPQVEAALRDAGLLS